MAFLRRFFQTPSARSLARYATVAGRVLTIAAVLLLVQSIFWTARVPLVFKLATVAIGVLAYARPGEALLVVTGLLPFGYVLTTRVWSVHPVALVEAFVLAFLSGYLTRTWRWRDIGWGSRDALTTPATVLAVVVLASCAVQFVVVRVWHDYTLPYTWTFLTYLVRDALTTSPDPRPWVQGQAFVMTAALLLEGVALMLAARALCRADRGLEGRVIGAMVLAGAGAAILSLLELAPPALRGEQVQIITGLTPVQRLTLFVPSLHSSSSYFVMIAFAAIASTVRSRIWAVAGVAAALLALAAMWLTGTRSGIVAALVIGPALAVWALTVRTRLLTPKLAVVAAAVIGIAIGVTSVAIKSAGIIGPRGYASLLERIPLAGAAVGMLEAHPLFGVGVGQYGLLYPRFASAEILKTMPVADAHDSFLWVAAEFGLVGFGAFAWLLGAAATRAWQRLRVTPSDLGFAALCGGLAAFLITWLSAHPLSVPVVTYTFWILLGVAAYAGGGNTAPEPNATDAARRQIWHRAAVAALVVFVIASVPIRARQAIDSVNFARVTYGFYQWETEGLSLQYRWTGPRATFFARATVSAVTIPLRAAPAAARPGTDAFEVRIFVNHERVGLARLTDDRWHELRVPAPDDRGDDRFWRIDLEVSPTWRPPDVLPGSTDPRTLGVKVGEIQTVQ